MENRVTTTKSTNEETSAIDKCQQIVCQTCKGLKVIPELWCKDPFHYDPVNHPSHYTKHPSGIECIQVTEHMNFNLGNAIKYIWRCQDKNGIEDLEKAIWYIKREIERLNRD